MIIRKLRLDNGWSQEQLAEMAGVSSRTIQRSETGCDVSHETIKCLAAVFEIDFNYLRQETNMTIDVPSLQEIAAMKYVRRMKLFYTHLIVYASVIIFLLTLNLVTSPRLYLGRLARNWLGNADGYSRGECVWHCTAIQPRLGATAGQEAPFQEFWMSALSRF